MSFKNHPKQKPKDDVVAVVCADMHLSMNPPVARSLEPDWFAAMAKPLKEINDLAKKYDVPVIIAGDIFHRWNSPPELINFAMANLPKNVIAIPGQHDLPYHRLRDIKKSAYWTLVKAGRIKSLSYPSGQRLGLIEYDGGSIVLHGFTYGEKLRPVSPEDESHYGRKARHLAIVHSFIWIDEETGFPGAPQEADAHFQAKYLSGYGGVFFGDNHKPFRLGLPYQWIVNCGAMMRRSVDQAAFVPKVYLLGAHTQGTGIARTVSLNTANESFDVPSEVMPDEKDERMISSFLKRLKSMKATSFDFEDAVKRVIDTGEIDGDVAQAILEAMQDEAK